MANEYIKTYSLQSEISCSLLHGTSIAKNCLLLTFYLYLFKKLKSVSFYLILYLEDNMRTDDDVRMDLKQFQKLFQRLLVEKEREVALARSDKMLFAAEIREMREIEANIEAIFERNSIITNLRVKKLIEAEKSKYELSMKGWKNRKDYALQVFEKLLKKKDTPGE